MSAALGVATTRDDELERRVAVQRADLQAFLLTLSDALRSLANASEIKAAASRILGEQLGVNRAFYADIAREDWLIENAYERDVEPRAAGRHPVAQFGQWIMETFRAGERLVIRDLHADARFAPSERAAHAAYRILGAVAVPLIKEGRLVSILVVQSAVPRDWSETEITLVEETAERTWAAVERARAEMALRESEASLQRRVEAAAAELRAVSRRLLSVREEERRFLARELR